MPSTYSESIYNRVQSQEIQTKQDNRILYKYPSQFAIQKSETVAYRQAFQ